MRLCLRNISILRLVCRALFLAGMEDWVIEYLLITHVGIFMGLIVILPLFMILYVGISAVGSLQVSYAAFDREMGPQTAMKGQ